MMMSCCLSTALLLLLLLLQQSVIVVKAQESLVMTVIAACDQCADSNGFDFLEFTACTSIANLANYGFVQYVDNFASSPSLTYNFPSVDGSGRNLTNLPAGTRIYVVSYDTAAEISKFFDYYDFTKSGIILLIDSNTDVSFYGFGNFALAYQGTVVDLYGVINVNHADTKADIENGWSVRVSKSRPTPHFNASNWILTPGAFLNQPEFNHQANVPLTFGSFACAIPPILSTPSPASFQPTLPGRGKGHDAPPDRNRAPAAPSPGKTTAPVTPPVAPPAPAPQAKTPNPRRKPATRKPRGAPIATASPTPGG